LKTAFAALGGVFQPQESRSFTHVDAKKCHRKGYVAHLDKMLTFKPLFETTNLALLGSLAMLWDHQP